MFRTLVILFLASVSFKSSCAASLDPTSEGNTCSKVEHDSSALLQNKATVAAGGSKDDTRSGEGLALSIEATETQHGPRAKSITLLAQDSDAGEAVEFSKEASKEQEAMCWFNKERLEDDQGIGITGWAGGKTAEQCKEECDSRSTCHSFSYHQATTECWLKEKAVTTSTPASINPGGWVTYYRVACETTTTVTCPTGYTNYFKGSGWTGEGELDGGRLEPASLDELLTSCAQKCNATAACVGISVDPRYPLCVTYGLPLGNQGRYSNGWDSCYQVGVPPVPWQEDK